MVALIIFVYINIFINLYIWEIKKQISDVALFNCIVFIGTFLSATYGARILRTQNVQYVMRIFTIISVISFLCLCFVTFHNKTLWVSIIGLFVGCMTGFFWMANNFAISTFGKGKETMEFLSKNTILNQAIGIIIPILSALIINWFGYRGSFILMLMFALMMFFAVNLIPKIKLNAGSAERYILMIKDSKTKWMIVSSFVGGMFTSFQSVFILIYTFTITDNKLVIALLSVGYTIISLLTYYAYKKGSWMGENNWLAFGMVLMSIGFISALAGNAAFLILSNVLTTIGSFFTGSVYSAQIFRVFEKDDPSAKANMLVIFEWALNLGRVLMLILVMFVKSPKGTYFLTLMAIAILLSLLIQKKMLQFNKSQ